MEIQHQPPWLQLDLNPSEFFLKLFSTFLRGFECPGQKTREHNQTGVS